MKVRLSESRSLRAHPVTTPDTAAERCIHAAEISETEPLPAKAGVPGMVKGCAAGLLGFTLAEVAIAVALLATMFVSFYAVLSSGFAFTQLGRENLRATQIMLESMEGVRLFTWDQLVSSNWIPSTYPQYYYPLMDSTNESRGILYTVNFSVVTNPVMNPAATYTNRLCAVTVTVNWTSGYAPRSRTMTTYVAKQGMQPYIYNN